MPLVETRQVETVNTSKDISTVSGEMKTAT